MKPCILPTLELLPHHEILYCLPQFHPRRAPYRHSLTVCLASRKGWNPDPSQDTRIHWSSPDEGWVGVPSSNPPLASDPDASSLTPPRFSVLDNLLSDLIARAHDTHYEFLGVPPDAGLEEIKAAYRKLSKLYHPDSTALPVEFAAQKFVRLKQAYNILSSVEERRFYDWALAQEVSRRQGGRFIWPFEADRTQRGPGSETVSQKAGLGEDGYVEINSQMQTALLFDSFAFLVGICAIIYVIFLKQ